jgi:hypothetical protein
VPGVFVVTGVRLLTGSRLVTSTCCLPIVWVVPSAGMVAVTFHFQGGCLEKDAIVLEPVQPERQAYINRQVTDSSTPVGCGAA